MHIFCFARKQHVLRRVGFGVCRKLTSCKSVSPAMVDLSTVCHLIRQECSGVPQGSAAKLQFFAFYCRKSSALFYLYADYAKLVVCVYSLCCRRLQDSIAVGAPSRNLRRGDSNAEGSYSWAPYSHRNTRCLVHCPAAVQAMGNSSPADWLLGLACRWSSPAGWCQAVDSQSCWSSREREYYILANTRTAHSKSKAMATLAFPTKSFAAGIKKTFQRHCVEIKSG